MKHTRRLARALAAAAFALAGCSGGGSQVTPGSPPAQNGSGAAGQQTTARFSLTIPAAGSAAAIHRRLPAYVSSSTLSASVQVNNGAATGVDLSASSPNCTAETDGRACIISVAAPVGADTFKVLLYSGPLANGSPTGALLSGASNFAATIAEGSANVTVPLVLGGYPSNVNLSAPGLVGRNPATVPMVVTAYDAEGNTIIGPAGYIDATGSPATLKLSLATTTSQFTLHDGTQSGTSVNVSGPTDTVTLQLNSPGTVLGGVFTVENSASSYLLPKVAGGQKVAVNGALTATQLSASISFAPDYIFFAPIDSRITTGIGTGFAFSLGTESSGQEIGYFNAGDELIGTCSYTSSFNVAVAPVPSGLAFSYNGAYGTNMAPFGVAFEPVSALLSGTCNASNTYQTSGTSGSPAHATSIVYDPSPGLLYEGESDGSLRSDNFSSSNFSNNTLIASGFTGAISSLVALNDRQFFLNDSNDNIYTQQGSSTPTAITAAGSSLTSLALSEEESAVYALDHLQKTVWVYSPTTGTAAEYAPANSFTGTLSTQQWNLAIGADGRAYATDGNSIIDAITTAGTQTSLTIPPPGGNTGYIRGIFDGHNGYLYVYYDDGLNAGIEYFFRISN